MFQLVRSCPKIGPLAYIGTHQRFERCSGVAIQSSRFCWGLHSSRYCTSWQGSDSNDFRGPLIASHWGVFGWAERAPVSDLQNFSSNVMRVLNQIPTEQWTVAKSENAWQCWVNFFSTSFEPCVVWKGWLIRSSDPRKIQSCNAGVWLPLGKVAGVFAWGAWRCECSIHWAIPRSPKKGEKPIRQRPPQSLQTPLLPRLL